MSENRFDCVIVGGGPGGYVAAIRARQLGLATALVEREHLGGICLNWGCIPTKALLRASELRHLIGQAGQFGLVTGDVSIDVEQVVKRSRKVAGQLSKGVAHLMKKNGVVVFEGHARLAGAGTVQVAKGDGSTSELHAPHLPHLNAYRTWCRRQYFQNEYLIHRRIAHSVDTNLPNRRAAHDLHVLLLMDGQ